MTAAPVTIVCANCGAKYKLPADFKAASAKCKGCGATIDVAGQMKASAAPAPAKATPSKPAGASKSVAASSTRSARDGESASSTRRDKAGSSASKRSSRRGDGEGAPEKKKSNALALGSIVGIVALGVAGYFIFSGGDKPAATPTAQGPAASAPVDPKQSEAKTDDGAAAAKAEADELAKSLKEDDSAEKKDEAKPEGDAKPVEATAKKEPPKKDEAKPAKEDKPAAKAEDKPAEKPAAAKGDEPKLTSMNEVFDAAALPPLTYPDDVGEELRKEIDSLCEDMKNGGMAGRRAKRRLEEIGHPGMVGVINMYQKLDFKSSEQSTLAFEINKFITNAYGAGVVSSGFKFVPPGEPMTPDTANFNAKSVEAWRRFWTTYSDKEKWENFVKARKDKGGAEESIK